MTDTSTADALAALRAAEAQLEATLAGEKGDAPIVDPPPAAPLTPDQIAAEFVATQAYRDAGSPPPAPLSCEIKLGPTVVG